MATTTKPTAPARPVVPPQPAGLPLNIRDIDPQETADWIASLDAVLENRGTSRARFLLARLVERAHAAGAAPLYTANTPYVNTIPVSQQPEYPGDRAIERRIKSLIRWNAMAMVVRANKKFPGLGGHISTYASAATLYEVGFNHFFRGKDRHGVPGDMVYFQGHASPGMYARAFLEGRLTAEELSHFRRELQPGGGLSSYPHPWLMPDFWEFPTVSMGIAPISAIYQARFNRYLKDRGLADTADTKVWAFLGDGETDEPETLGAITLASREGLDNLIFVINCNLQRLDGPVRGNGKIIQELEAAFRGAGWNVIKVIWSSDWDPILAKDDQGLLVRRMGQVCDGQYQKYIVEPGSYTRQDFFGAHPQLLQMVEDLSDEQIHKLRRGGHDPLKVYAAYHAAVQPTGRPTVILAKTVKGYGLGEAGEGRNVTHQMKKLQGKELQEFRDRFEIPIPDKQLDEMPFFHPGQDSDEFEYLVERRRTLGGWLPKRVVRAPRLQAPPLEFYSEFLKASAKGRGPSTTMAFVGVLAALLKDKTLGQAIVPIIPDEARTFGMEPLFRHYGIYAHEGQLYEPVDAKMLLYYREAKDGQILEEGITEAGAMSSFVAAATSYANHAVNMIPFFIFYSMFGFQRIGDLIWANGDIRGKGFLLGATCGRTTLAGEGLQHQDGHSPLVASTVPNCVTYDPAFAYELAVIIQDGIRRMYQEGESIFYYLTLYNEKYDMPGMADGSAEGILQGMYKFRPAADPADRPRVHLFGSGSILREVLRAQELLAGRYGVAADVWSVTSFNELRREAIEAERYNMLHPAAEPRVPYVARQLQDEPWPVVAASDYMRTVPDQVRPWVPRGMVTLGTDGFGRSDTREALRRFFEVDAECVTVAALHALARQGAIPRDRAQQAIAELGIDPDKAAPFLA